MQEAPFKIQPNPNNNHALQHRNGIRSCFPHVMGHPNLPWNTQVNVIMLLSSFVHKLCSCKYVFILKHYKALKMSAAISETFNYAHPAKEVLSKTTIYHLVKKFWTQKVFKTGNKSILKEFWQMESCWKKWKGQLVLAHTANTITALLLMIALLGMVSGYPNFCEAWRN